ncbi:MAG: Oligopeptide-binding protein OppA [Chlamydiia bacterium]|nr:Oligopeptide-binding protein OppA [Chlamydiia bacterium]
MKKTFTPMLFCILSTIAVFSCSHKGNTKKKSVNGIHINVLQDPTTLDSRKCADFISSCVQFLLFEGLVRMTPDSIAAPGIARDIFVSDDGLKYTFRIRDAQWSNGTPITAYDFAQTWLDMLDPLFPSPNAHLLFPIKNAEKAKRGDVPLRDVGIKVVDYKTLEVYLKNPTPYFKELISFTVFNPICQHHIQDNEDWAKRCDRTFICNGPYRLAKRRPGRDLILEKNPYYWDADSVELEQISISIVDSETTALNLFNNNELDLLGIPFRGIPSDSIPDLLDRGLIETTDIPASTICCFNLERYPFNNKNIRKAFAYSINRKDIVNHVTSMSESPGVDLLPENLLPNQPTPFFTDGDIETARMYLEKGLKELDITIEDLPTITLLHSTTGIYPKIAQAIQDQWKKGLGISVELNGFEYKVFLDHLNKKNFCIGQCVWIAQYPDPMDLLDRFRLKENTKNYSGYDNKKYQEILEGSLYHQDKIKRYDELKKALNILNEEVPVTAIYHWKNAYMKKPYIKGLKISPFGFSNLTGIKVIKDKSPIDQPIIASVK